MERQEEKVAYYRCCSCGLQWSFRCPSGCYPLLLSFASESLVGCCCHASSNTSAIASYIKTSIRPDGLRPALAESRSTLIRRAISAILLPSIIIYLYQPQKLFMSDTALCLVALIAGQHEVFPAVFAALRARDKVVERCTQRIVLLHVLHLHHAFTVKALAFVLLPKLRSQLFPAFQHTVVAAEGLEPSVIQGLSLLHLPFCYAAISSFATMVIYSVNLNPCCALSG